MSKKPIILLLYRFFISLFLIPIIILLLTRSFFGKEKFFRLFERFGLSKSKRPKGILIWCHAASVGETITLLPLLEELLSDKKINILVTTATISGSKIISSKKNTRILHQLSPWDHHKWIKKFLQFWQPDLAIRMESELWPNTLVELNERKIPTAIVNGRISKNSLKRWKAFPSIAKYIMRTINLVLSQSEIHAHNFKTLGALNIKITGNLKLSMPPLKFDIRSQQILKEAFNSRPVWVAASTHPGEEEITLNTHIYLKKQFPKILTVIVPRHPERSKNIIKKVKKYKLNSISRSSNKLPEESTDIYIIDNFGELGLIYSLVEIVFIGKSLTGSGGQNPIEPIHFGCKVIFGPKMDNFYEIAEDMVKNNIASQVKNTQELSEIINDFLMENTPYKNIINIKRFIKQKNNNKFSLTSNYLIELLINQKKL